MVSKNNFQQNVRGMHMQLRAVNIRASIAPYRKPYKAPITGNAMLFSSSCQMPSDPLYIDFNNPAPVSQHKQNAGSAGCPDDNDDGVEHMQTHQQKKKGPKSKHKGVKQQQILITDCNNMNGALWHNNKRNMYLGDSTRFNGAMQRSGVIYNPPQMLAGPPSRGGVRHIRPSMGPMGMRCPLPPHPALGFQPPMVPLRGRVPPIGGIHPPPPPPHLLLRGNGRHGVSGGPIHPMPPPMLPMIGPRMPPIRGPPALMPFNACSGNGIGGGYLMNNNHCNNSGKIKKPNPKLVKQAVKGKSTVKTLKNLINQYPIDKPWVTVAIRFEHDKKVDIENRLKGNKDDELFAQFKVQRDKFVAMYETAREEYLKKEAATVMAKDATKEKQTNSNKITAANAGNNSKSKNITNDANANQEQQQNAVESKVQ